ncbi:MAG: DMT family transporter [Rhodospirillales bacterium]
MAPMTHRRAYLLLASVILLWGVNWPVMKVGLLYMPPLWFAAMRVLLGGACLFALVAARGRLRVPERRDFPILISVSVLQIALFLGLIHFSLQYVDAGRSAILSYTTPLWITPMAVVLLNETMTRGRLAGLGLGLGGIGVLFNPATFDYSQTPALIGNGLLLLAALGWAVGIIHVRVHRWVMTSLELMPWQMLIGGILLAALAAWTEGDLPVRWSGTLAAILAYNGLVASAFCYWAFVTVTRSLPATSTAMGALGVPVAGVLFSALFLAEPLSATIIAGLGLITAGVALVVIGDLREG